MATDPGLPPDIDPSTLTVPQAPAAPSTDAQITGAADAQPVKPAQKIMPHQVILNSFDPEILKNVAHDAGLDMTNLPAGYFDKLSARYNSLADPDTLQKVQGWVNASGIGHFMHGFNDAGAPANSPGILEAVGSPSDAAEYRADRFFNAQIQARYIDQSKYIDKAGNYQPPMTYKVGAALGDPKNQLMALGGVAAARWGFAGLAGVARATNAWAAANPVAGGLLKAVAHGSAIGAAMKLFGGSSGPPPPP